MTRIADGMFRAFWVCWSFVAAVLGAVMLFSADSEPLWARIVGFLMWFGLGGVCCALSWEFGVPEKEVES